MLITGRSSVESARCCWSLNTLQSRAPGAADHWTLFSRESVRWRSLDALQSGERQVKIIRRSSVGRASGEDHCTLFSRESVRWRSLDALQSGERQVKITGRSSVGRASGEDHWTLFSRGERQVKITGRSSVGRASGEDHWDALQSGERQVKIIRRSSVGRASGEDHWTLFSRESARCCCLSLGDSEEELTPQVMSRLSGRAAAEAESCAATLSAQVAEHGWRCHFRRPMSRYQSLIVDVNRHNSKFEFCK